MFVIFLRLFFQENVADLPRFCLFYIAFFLELVALVLSAIADVSPEVKELAKKVNVVVCCFFCFVFFSSYLFLYTIYRHKNV